MTKQKERNLHPLSIAGLFVVFFQAFTPSFLLTYFRSSNVVPESTIFFTKNVNNHMMNNFPMFIVTLCIFLIGFVMMAIGIYKNRANE